MVPVETAAASTTQQSSSSASSSSPTSQTTPSLQDAAAGVELLAHGGVQEPEYESSSAAGVNDSTAAAADATGAPVRRQPSCNAALLSFASSVLASAGGGKQQDAASQATTGGKQQSSTTAAVNAARRVFNPHELAAASLRLIASVRRKIASEEAASLAQNEVSSKKLPPNLPSLSTPQRVFRHCLWSHSQLFFIWKTSRWLVLFDMSVVKLVIHPYHQLFPPSPQEAVPPVVTVASSLRRTRAGRFVKLVEERGSDREVLINDPDGARAPPLTSSPNVPFTPAESRGDLSLSFVPFSLRQASASASARTTSRRPSTTSSRSSRSSSSRPSPASRTCISCCRPGSPTGTRCRRTTPSGRRWRSPSSWRSAPSRRRWRTGGGGRRTAARTARRRGCSAPTEPRRRGSGGTCTWATCCWRVPVGRCLFLRALSPRSKEI